MTAIVCQFLWSGIAPSGEDKSQSTGPQYMLKVSCDAVELYLGHTQLWYFTIAETRNVSPQKILVGRETCLTRCNDNLNFEWYCTRT